MQLTGICCLSAYGSVYFVYHSKLNGKTLTSLKRNGIISSVIISKYHKVFPALYSKPYKLFTQCSVIVHCFLRVISIAAELHMYGKAG